MRKLALPIALVFGIAMIGCPGDDNNCVDVDGDGYGEGSDCLGADCDDGDEAVWMSMDGYGDVDEDGESDTDPTSLCTDGTLPAGYSDAAGTDCDDTNADAITRVDGYLDADGDGYGTGDVMDVCGDSDYLPPGYADNGDDCDDSTEMAYMEWTGYADYDEDGVYSDVATTLCGTEVMPAGYGDVAGTDCDEVDMFVQTSDATTAAMCNYKGTCLDTEMSVGFPDMTGIGACVTVDCNGADPACGAIGQPPMTDTTTACVDENDCNTGELCWSPGVAATTCWSIPACCNNNSDPTTGLYCSEILDCLSDCASLLPDTAAYAGCQQMACFENGRPQSQELYRVAAECAAAADCWALVAGGAEAIQGCVQANCLADFGPCLTDVRP